MADVPPNSIAARSATTVYRAVARIADGGMGSVELAVTASGRRLGQLAAIKRLHPHLAREAAFLAMFFEEARITSGLRHPHVVGTVDWGEDEHGPFLALEYVPGESLVALARAAARAGVAFPVDLALYVVARAAEGLHAAHELRDEGGAPLHVVHRDVSPSNILVGIHGQVTVIDFGVARSRDRLHHTAAGELKGKFAYMSPEQARGHALDRRSDVFSLGIVLWELLAGRRLFRSGSQLETLRRIVEEPAPALGADRPDLPPAVDRLLAAMLARNRDERLGSAAEVADFLWRIYADRGYTAGEDALGEFFHKLLPERHAAITALLATATVLVEETTRIHVAVPAARVPVPLVPIAVAPAPVPVLSTPRSRAATAVTLAAAGFIALGVWRWTHAPGPRLVSSPPTLTAAPALPLVPVAQTVTPTDPSSASAVAGPRDPTRPIPLTRQGRRRPAAVVASARDPRRPPTDPPLDAVPPIAPPQPVVTPPEVVRPPPPVDSPGSSQGSRPGASGLFVRGWDNR